MKLCHGTKNLTALGRSNRKDREEHRFVCKCGQHWQWTPSAGYYQVSKTKGNGVKRQVAVKMYGDVRDAVKAGHGSVQKYLDYCLRRDGYV